MRRLRMIFILPLLWPFLVAATEAPRLESEADRVSYSVGYQIGGDFDRQGVMLNAEALLRGIADARDESARPLMSRQEMQTTLVELKRRIEKEQGARLKAAAERYRGEGREFLAANAQREGVVVLPSGLQYQVLEPGSGARPAVGDTVTVVYRGTLIDGTEFDGSERDGGPVSLALDQVIPGWKEALPLMKAGAKWRLFLPPDLAFGERGPLADRTVIYDIELLAVEPATGT